MNVGRIAVIAPGDELLEQFYAAVRVVDEQTPPASEMDYHLTVDEALTVDFSQHIELAEVGKHPVEGFTETFGLDDAMGVLVLFESAEERRLNSVQQLIAALRVRAPHLPVYFAVPDDPTTSREDEIRITSDMMLDEDPIHLYTSMDTDTVRDLLVKLMNEVARVNDEYAAEANNILDILLADE